jgi:hypothetical protein
MSRKLKYNIEVKIKAYEGYQKGIISLILNI